MRRALKLLGNLPRWSRRFATPLGSVPFHSECDHLRQRRWEAAGSGRDLLVASLAASLQVVVMKVCVGANAQRHRDLR